MAKDRKSGEAEGQFTLADEDPTSVLGPQYPPEFLEQHAGKIVRDPGVAVMELIANAWDAGAKDVRVIWPANPGDEFAITDDGVGMGISEFEHRWLNMGPTHNVNVARQVRFPDGTLSNRTALGRNGKGRHAMFYFADEYSIRTRRDGKEISARVRLGSGHAPFEMTSRQVVDWEGPSGTELRATSRMAPTIQTMRDALATRFVADPQFRVYLNAEQVNFFDIDDADDRLEVPFGDGVIRVGRVDSDKSSRVRLDSGVTWWTDRRMVVAPSWEGESGHRILDGRRKPSRRITYIVQADVLRPHVLPDWSGYAEDELVHEARRAVAACVQANLDSSLGSRKKEVKQAALKKHRASISRLNPVQREDLAATIDAIQDLAPRVDEQVAGAIVQVLSTMKEAESGVALLHKLAGMTSGTMDQLNEVLDKWEVGQARAVLDLVHQRLAVIQELERRTQDIESPELQILQPLFERALWIFGPEYDTPEFTSNRQLLTVVKELLRLPDSTEVQGGRRRPDFVILADRSYSVWARNHFTTDGDIDGLNTVLVLELKRAGITVGTAENLQALGYANAIRATSTVSPDPIGKINVIVLGSNVDPSAAKGNTGDGIVVRAISYGTLILNAKSRMLNLERIINEHSTAGEFHPIDPELEMVLNPEQTEVVLDGSSSD